MLVERGLGWALRNDSQHTAELNQPGQQVPLPGRWGIGRLLLDQESVVASSAIDSHGELPAGFYCRNTSLQSYFPGKSAKSSRKTTSASLPFSKICTSASNWGTLLEPQQQEIMGNVVFRFLAFICRKAHWKGVKKC